MKMFKILLLNVISVFSINAQNLIDENASGFEGPKSGWWIQHKKAFQFSTRQVRNGNFSLKYHRTNLKPEEGVMQVHSKTAFPKGLRSGKYRLTANVYLSHFSPKGFNFNFSGDNWTPIFISFKNLPTSKWITITKEVTLKKRVSGEVILAVSEDKRYGGNGTFYIDDITFEKLKKR